MANETKRRPRGQGALRQLPDGRWQIRVWAGANRVQRTFSTQQEALVAIDDVRGKAAKGIVATRRYTLGQLFDDFIEDGQATRGWAPRTVRSYESVIASHLRPPLGKVQLADLSVRDVSKVLAKMVANDASGRHVAHVRGVLRTALGYAMRMELVERNVASLAASPPVRRKEMRALSRAETRLLFGALDGERLRPAIIMAASLGLRLGELVALKWADVDLDGAMVTVRRTGTRIKGKYLEGEPKTEDSQRSIALPAAIVAMLKTQRSVIAAERLRLGKYWLDEDRAFPGPAGGPCGESPLRRTLNRALAKAGLPHIRIHDLRHTAASGVLAAGGSLYDVKELLGHSDYNLTANLYAHFMDEQRRATADRVQEALGDAIVSPASAL